MVKAKFIGGYMDGEWLCIPRAIPIYRFERCYALRFNETTNENAHLPPKVWAEDYELDSWEDDRVFYRRVGLPPQ